MGADRRLIAPSTCQYEVSDVARRHFGVAGARTVWQLISRDGIALLGMDAELTERMFEMCGSLGCTMYDAAAPALARYLNCGLVSADRRAHGAFEGVPLIG